MKALLAKVDRFQRAHRASAFGYGVVKKYGDDRGSALSALITYYGFLSLFPLLLLFYTVTSYVLANDAKLQAKLSNSVLGEFPVIGTQLQSTKSGALHGSPLALVVGVLGLAWGALGVSQILQQTMHDVWSREESVRPKFVARVTKGLLLFLVLGVGVVATTVVASLGSVLKWGPFGSVLAALPAAVVNIAMFWAMFRLLSPAEARTGALLPGAIVAGIGWQILQTVGVNLVTHQLRHSGQVYGVFGFTLALLSFLYLAAQLTVYSAEINVVRARHLWPRSMLAPSGDAAGRQVATPRTASGARTDWTVDTGRSGSKPAVP